jgi:hypothetical protein
MEKKELRELGWRAEKHDLENLSSKKILSKKPLSKAMRKYLEKKLESSLLNCGEKIPMHPIALCIPVSYEYPHFFRTLRSIHLSAMKALSYLGENYQAFSIVCCINARENDALEVKENNAKLLHELRRLQKTEFDGSFMNLHILDYSHEGAYFKKKDGVGLARKIALDWALKSGAEVLASLDADCLVSENYLYTLALFYQKYKNKSEWALCGFSHQEPAEKAHKKAMDAYETYLHEHSQFLFDIASPYYPVALGPTIICTSEAYVRSGGMNKKIAGEDFYFLQSLIKLNLKKRIEDYLFLASKVYPSARLSKRVLFGTGTALEEILGGKKKGFEKKQYIAAKDFFSLFNTMLLSFYEREEKSIEMLLEFEKKLKNSSSQVYAFLAEDRFWIDWEKIVKTHFSSKENLRKAFFERFDGLKTIRLFNYLAEVHKSDF